MIRSTLFKSVAPALRDSLNDAEVGALGMWLLMSAGAYPSRLAMFAKDGMGTEELEAIATAKYVYPEGAPQEELMTGGMTNPDYRLPTANRMTAANVIAGLEDLMYTITTSNEERDNPHRTVDTPTVNPFVERTPEQRPIPDVAAQWQAREFLARAIPPPTQENRIVGREARVNIPRTPLRNVVQAEQARVLEFEQQALAEQAEAANAEFVRQTAEWLRERAEAARTEQRMVDMRERMARVEQAEVARVDALANRTRGIPNRR